MTVGFDLMLEIILTCDQNWAEQTDPDPKIGAQSHLVQARINESYTASANGYTVKSTKIVKEIIHLNPDYFGKPDNQALLNSTLVADMVTCNKADSKGKIKFKLIQNEDNSFVIDIQGTLNVDDPFLEGHVHEFGDISRCVDSVGKRINVVKGKYEEGI